MRRAIFNFYSTATCYSLLTALVGRRDRTTIVGSLRDRLTFCVLPRRQIYWCFPPWNHYYTAHADKFAIFGTERRRNPYQSAIPFHWEGLLWRPIPRLPICWGCPDSYSSCPRLANGTRSWPHPGQYNSSNTLRLTVLLTSSIKASKTWDYCHHDHTEPDYDQRFHRHVTQFFLPRSLHASTILRQDESCSISITRIYADEGGHSKFGSFKMKMTGSGKSCKSRVVQLM